MLRYVNPKTKARIDLGGLTDEEKNFYQQAWERFQQNVAWPAFDEFAFGLRSPIYSQRRSHLEVVENSLFQALLDMSMQLGVQQGIISRQTREFPRRRPSSRAGRRRSRQPRPRLARRRV